VTLLTLPDLVDLYQQRRCPVYVWGVALGHQEIVRRWLTVQGSAEAQWSESWEIIDHQLEGQDGYGYRQKMILRLATYPGYLWTEYETEHIKIFVAPEDVAQAVSRLCRAGIEEKDITVENLA
jgi:hypothetical protein